MHTLARLVTTLLGRRPLRFLLNAAARVIGILALVLAVRGPLSDVLAAWRSRRATRSGSRARSRQVLASIYDRYPRVSSAARRPRGLQAVPLDQIVGTTRHPSQNTADFQPLPQLRGRNWEARWQRISRAMERLEMLPPVELVKVGDEYFVDDGHNRVAAALDAGAVAIDADVTELVMPGVESGPAAATMSSSLVGTDELRQAGTGRLSRTAEHRTGVDVISRRDLLRASGENPRPPGEETEVLPVVDVEPSAASGGDEPEA